MSAQNSNVRVVDAMSAAPLHVDPHRGGTIASPEAFVHRLLATISALEAELELQQREAMVRKGVDLAGQKSA